MFPGMGWELDTQSRQIALDEAVRDGQLERAALAAREERQDSQTPRRRWIDRLATQVGGWMSAGTPSGRGASPSTR